MHSTSYNNRCNGYIFRKYKLIRKKFENGIRPVSIKEIRMVTKDNPPAHKSPDSVLRFHPRNYKK